MIFATPLFHLLIARRFSLRGYASHAAAAIDAADL